MGDWLTNQQKKDLARRDFRHIAVRRRDHQIPWDDCEKIIKRIFLHASAAQIDGLLSDADEDGTNLIRRRPFMKVVKYLLNEPVDTVDEDEDQDGEDEDHEGERTVDEHLADEHTVDKHLADERLEPPLLDEDEQRQNLLDFAKQLKQMVEVGEQDGSVPNATIKEFFKLYKIFD